MPDSMTSFVLYCSQARHREFDPSDLDILRQSIRANNEHGVTGFLHREDGYYFQYFEGAEPAVRTLYENIRRDSRHFGIATMQQGEAPQRLFDGWSMGYGRKSDAALGFSDRGQDPYDLPWQDVVDFLRAAAARQVKVKL